MSAFVVIPALQAYGEPMDKEHKDPLDLSVVDLNNAEERRRFLEVAIKEGGERSKRAYEELRALGLIDADGRPVSTELPEDMRPDAGTDVGN